jgi:two-component system, response regulator PdtaR
MKVLVVDDEPLVRLSLKRALVKHGHEVQVAEDGQSGLEAFTAFHPHLVYLDVLMPRMSGPDLLKNLPAAARGTAKVILMSAFAGEYDLEKAKSLGADLFIPKPFEDVFTVVRQGEELFK